MDVVADPRRALTSLGLCPQTSALFDNLTAREHLLFYAAVNGAPRAHVPLLADAALASLDLSRYAGTLAAHLSGGNRRRLSLALAYMGAPRAVFIDEVSSGVFSSSACEFGSCG